MKTLLNRRGFTLIELLIVVAIIAILAAIAVPNFLEAQTRAKVSRAYNDMRCAATGLESYRVDNNKYPPNYSAGSYFWLYAPWSLTSPINYVPEACLFDVFQNIDDVDPSFTGDANPLFYKRLIYQNTQFFFDLKAQGINLILVSDGLPIEGNTPTKQGAWLMASIGPDLRYGPILAQRGGAQRLTVLYDPTNGTTSLGDIVRTQRDSTGKGIDTPGGAL